MSSPTDFADEAENLVGEAVVRAVGLHKTAKGPRLFCDHSFIDAVGEDTRAFICQVPNTAVSELLWPAFHYTLGGDPEVEIHEFLHHWRPAVGLWRANQRGVAFEHYDEFLRLLVRSFLCWARHEDYEQRGLEYVRQVVRDDLGDVLVQRYVGV